MPPVQTIVPTIAVSKKPITDAEVASAIFERILASKDMILIGPGVSISYIPQGYSLVLNTLTFPTAPEAKCWYQTDGGYSLSFVALSQLAKMAGIQWTVSEPVPCRDRNHWKHRVEATLRSFAGRDEPYKDGAELDLRDGSAEAGDKPTPKVIKKRQKGAAHCASSAKARLIRQALGIRPYTKEEMNKTFVLPALVWIPPVGNPDVDRMIAAKELGIVDAIYGRRIASHSPLQIAGPTAEEADLEEDGDPVDFAAENARLNEREKVETQATQAARQGAAQGQPSGGERMPWDDEPPAGRQTTPAAATVAMRFDHKEEDVIAWVMAVYDGFNPNTSANPADAWARLAVKLESPAKRAEMESFIKEVLKR